MLKLGSLAAIITTSAGQTLAVPVVLDFQSQPSGCATGPSAISGISIEETHCSLHNASGYQYIETGQAFTIIAQGHTSFDFLGANLLYYWDETFGLPVDDVPAGLDMTNPTDILHVNQNWLWQSGENELPQISLKGYADGVLVSEWSEIFLHTESYLSLIDMTPDPASIDWDPRDLPGAPMFGLDRLEFTVGGLLADANFEQPVLIGDSWYAPSVAQLVFDDVRIEITGISVPPEPTPVPLPASAALLFAALGWLCTPFCKLVVRRLTAI